MSKHILVVDDESDVREVVRLLLEGDDHTVVESNNGAEALGIFRKGRFDLVMTDHSMPHVMGNELAMQIKALSPSQPILMLTEHLKKAGPDNPVDAVLRKPLGIRDLRETMARLLSTPSQTQQC